MALWSLWGNRTIRLTDGDFWRAFFGLGSHSGESVSFESAMQLDAVWACMRLVSEVAGSLPCLVYDAEGSNVVRGHPLFELLHDAPNLDESAVEFWEGCVRCMLMGGNFFAEKKMNGGGVLTALNPLPMGTVQVKRRPSGARHYVAVKDGKAREIPEDRMFHVRNMKMPGEDVGLPTITYARHGLGGAIAAEKTAGKMFSNGINAAGMISSDQVLNPTQREQIGNMLKSYSGSERAGKLMVLEAGLKYQQLSLTPEDAQMLATRQFSVEQICRWFGVPPIMIGHAATGLTTWGSGVEQIILQFVKSGLRPLLKRIEGAIRRDLLTPGDRQTIRVKFNMEGLLRGDSAARAAFYSSMGQNGVMTRREMRRLENLPPKEGDDVLTVQSNLVPLDQLGERPDGASQFANGLAAMITTAVEQAVRNAPKE